MHFTIAILKTPFREKLDFGLCKIQENYFILKYSEWTRFKCI